MVKYIATKREGDVIKVDFEEQKVGKTSYGSGFDYSYVITEAGEWIVDDKKLFDVKEGDLVVKMYSITNNWEEKEFIKITSAELVDYYKRREEAKEQRELKKVLCEDCVCCDKA